MINHLLAICSVIIIFEFTRYFKFVVIIKNNLKIYLKIIKLFKFRAVSDSRKEKLIMSYSKSLFIFSIKILTILFSVIIFIIILNFISGSFFNFVSSIYGIIELSIIFMIYGLIRKKINAKL